MQNANTIYVTARISLSMCPFDLHVPLSRDVRDGARRIKLG